jgi:hypothetical protein
LITFLVRRRHRYTLDPFTVAYAPRFPFTCRVLSYERALRARRLPGGTYVFGDLERLDGSLRERAAHLWRTLCQERGVRVLNDPVRSFRRYELLRTLHEAGINDFDALRLSESRAPARWPVFLRGENDHEGSASPLLHDPSELTKAVADLEARGKSREDHLVVEFCAERTPEDLYCKYAAFVVGERIVPRHVFFDRHWVVKSATVVDEALAARELAVIRANPHEAALRKVASLARIEYGRIDYGVVDGRVQVYEINTNPGTVGTTHGEGPRAAVHHHFAGAFIAALAAVDVEGDAPVPIPGGGDWRRSVRELALEHLSDLLRVLGLGRFEPRIQTRLYAWRSRRPRW